VAGLDPGTLVADAEEDAVGGGPAETSTACPRAAVLHGVVHQVADRLLDELRADPRSQPFGTVHLDGDALFLGGGGEGGDGALEQGGGGAGITGD
jgi:hypothetical protein